MLQWLFSESAQGSSLTFNQGFSYFNSLKHLLKAKKPIGIIFHMEHLGVERIEYLSKHVLATCLIIPFKKLLLKIQYTDLLANEYSCTTRFIQMMTLDWPRQGQICYLDLLYGKILQRFWTYRGFCVKVGIIN